MGGPASGLAVRRAVATDAPFLVEMLVEAAGWSALGLASPAVVLDEPALARYVVGWPRDGDLGVVAVCSGRPVGAAWLRYFTAAEPAYGFVRPDVPELAVAVVDGWRGQGVGRLLLRELETAAGRAGIAAVSLSVRRTNPALALYRSAGYRVVAPDGESDTMIKELRADASDPPAT